MERPEETDSYEKQSSQTPRGRRASVHSLSLSTGSDKAQPPEDKREEPPEPAKGEERSKVAIIVDGTSNAQRHGSSHDVLPRPPQQETPASLAMRIAAAVIVVLIVINVLVFAYASIMSSAEPPLRQLTDPPGGNPIYDIPARVFNVTVTSGEAENRTWDNVTQG
ncbi:hypothetical protein MRX96_056465 [Rhipicephalus microplus]